MVCVSDDHSGGIILLFRTQMLPGVSVSVCFGSKHQDKNGGRKAGENVFVLGPRRFTPFFYFPSRPAQTGSNCYISNVGNLVAP